MIFTVEWAQIKSVKLQKVSTIRQEPRTWTRRCEPQDCQMQRDRLGGVLACLGPWLDKNSGVAYPGIPGHFSALEAARGPLSEKTPHLFTRHNVSSFRSLNSKTTIIGTTLLTAMDGRMGGQWLILRTRDGNVGPKSGTQRPVKTRKGLCASPGATCLPPADP
jgi:hypothetical protein